jgi:hypothetical protein
MQFHSQIITTALHGPDFFDVDRHIKNRSVNEFVICCRCYTNRICSKWMKCNR